MKKLHLLSLLFFVFAFKAQTILTYSSTCSKVDTITNFYSEDAKKLNFRYIHRSNNTYKDSIALNPAITHDFERALLAIYNATNMPARDTVVRILKIHAFNPMLHTLLIQADSNLAWMKKIRANIFPTGYNTIDSLMTKFYLKKAFYATYSAWYANLILQCDTALNTLALERFIQTLPGVHDASYDWLAGEQPDIEDTVNANFHWFRYTYGWGDCPSLCQYHRYWQFRVLNDCSVQYGGSYGYELTVGIKQNSLTFKDLQVYPNPAHDKLTIDNVPYSSRLSLISVLGKEVYSGVYTDNKMVIDLSDKPAGIYFLKMSNQSETHTTKIIVN